VFVCFAREAYNVLDCSNFFLILDRESKKLIWLEKVIANVLWENIPHSSGL